ncbi:hypothetical protein CDCA_CDCA06G1777 [Cyanidium caldarium]|uniref:Mitochondrial carrier protein n=1 Tax=Cyanidium caldarium TaxID=2771 RepID=A0AAV9ITV2_CYACA|nr:hypothetical protein CDCA_CDCA06G1777 [Cyanidium caldarium]
MQKDTYRIRRSVVACAAVQVTSLSRRRDALATAVHSPATAIAAPRSVDASLSTAGLDAGALLREVCLEFAAALRTNRMSLVASAVARAVSVLVMYPLDTLKTRLQAAPVGATSSAGALLRTAVQRGNWYAGVTSTLIGQTPYGALTFGSYETYKQLLERAGIHSRKLRWVVAAALGDLTGSLWLTPSEVVKQQMQAAHDHSGHVLQAAARVWQRRGLAGFYQGYTGQIARDVPFRTIQLLLFEDLRERWERNHGRALTSGENVLVGAIAGSLTATITNPLDVIKTRLMTGREYRNAADALWRLLRTEPLALMRGVVPRVVYIGPSSAIFFWVYTSLQTRFGQPRTAPAGGQKTQPRR